MIFGFGVQNYQEIDTKHDYNSFRGVSCVKKVACINCLAAVSKEQISNFVMFSMYSENIFIKFS